jgi:hypothetical protein
MSRVQNTYANTIFMRSISKQEPLNRGQTYIHFKNDILEYLNAVSMKISKVIFPLGVS